MKTSKKPLLEVWDLLKKENPKRQLLLLLDFDGTLTPIAETPAHAILSQKTRGLLKKLAARRDITLGVISGRGLKDVQAKVGIKNIIYAGNHGFEIRGPGIRFDRINRSQKKVMQEIHKKLVQKFSDIPEIFLEDKGITLSLHYRRVPVKMRPRVSRIFHQICNPYLQENKIKIGRGKKVFEVRPPVDWGKGRAVEWLLKRSRNKKVWPIYIGDDQTDEDAFEVLRGQGLSVVVGKRAKSCAQYHLKNPAEVTKFLQRLLI
ncbi:MAG: trehalose-phosphatase [Candidatus Omnitrophica bacterium]|nr:trehalose-phosphatase [Candidatus Omnitrophota bacterium]